MGWYLRKSFGFGPLRLNLSKSGLGASVGVRGARIGIGPRGNYVRLGRGGLYYQRYFRTAQETSRPASPIVEPALASPAAQIVTADVSQLKDSTAETLLQELTEKHNQPRMAPIFAFAFVIATVLMLSVHLSIWIMLLFAGLFIYAHAELVRSDQEKKVTVLNYGLDNEAKSRYVGFLKVLQSFADSARMWRVDSEEFSRDVKYTAGAKRLMNRRPISLRLAAPEYVETNLAVWKLALGTQDLYFFPDRVLVYDGSRVGAVSYNNLTIGLDQVRFFESDGVPSDSQVLGHTWQYVNKKGGPDRRFAHNPEIPIVQYAELWIHSSSGMNFVMQCSSPAKAAEFQAGVEVYAAKH